MLKENELTEKSIELWCDEMEKCTRRPYSDEELKYLKILTRKEDRIEKDPEVEKVIHQRGSMSLMILERMNYMHTFTMSKAALMMLSILCDRPGIAAEYLCYVQYRCHRQGISHIDMTAFCTYLFPKGPFRMDDLHRLWELQKIETTDSMFGILNLVDQTWCMSSLYITKKQ